MWPKVWPLAAGGSCSGAGFAAARLAGEPFFCFMPALRAPSKNDFPWTYSSSFLTL